MERWSLSAVCAALLVISSDFTQAQDAIKTVATPLASSLISGINLDYIDTKTRAQDDFYRYANGKWLDTTEIPADKSSYGVGKIVVDLLQDRLHGLVDNAAASTQVDPDPSMRKIGDLYASFMDESALERLDLKPLVAELARIDALRGNKSIPALIAQLNRSSVTIGYFGLQFNAPLRVVIHPDNKDATKYIADLQQGGLGLPDRDYYLNNDDDKLKGIRDQYRKHIEKMLTMAGDAHAGTRAEQILTLETALAKVQWDNVALRDPIKAYNKIEVTKLTALAPGIDWDIYLNAAGLKGKVDTVIISQPSYLTALGKLVSGTSLSTWKTYFRWRLLSDFAPMLSKRFVDENFAFYGTVLRGVPQQELRWKRGLAVVNASLGEELGKLYIAKYFPSESKARAQQLVTNLIAAFKQSIDNLDWMGPNTKRAAQAKLAKLTVKIGYPDVWRDYSALTINKTDLVGNLMRAAKFEYQRYLNKLGKPIDNSEWDMTPHTLDAYYNPERNEIVFPAAILQPPYFNPQADDAVNYGSVGAVIGHEISHGFDDQGAQYDGDGNLRDWWTKEDHEKFVAKTKTLVSEYNAFEPVASYHINGELTLGENIADNSGLAVAHRAYQIALEGKLAPVLNGLSGDQRFYVGYAQVWCNKMRDNTMIGQIKTDPHSPSMYRVLGAVVNQEGFYNAFDVKPGDKLYRSPEQRVNIW